MSYNILFKVFHSFCISLLTIPFSVLFFGLFINEGSINNEIIISDISIDPTIGIIVFSTLLILMALNYIALAGKLSFTSSIANGIFFFAISSIHVHRLYCQSQFKIFGAEINEEISWIPVLFLIPFSILCLILAKHGRKNAEFSLFDSLARFRSKIESVSSFTAIFLGFGACILTAIPISLILILLAIVFLVEKDLFEIYQIKQLALGGFVGAQGSICSILLRLKQLKLDHENYLLFFNSLSKPFIGLSLAHLTYFLLLTSFLPYPHLDKLIQEREYLFIYLAYAFIAGFSERFSKDLIKRVDIT